MKKLRKFTISAMENSIDGDNCQRYYFHVKAASEKQAIKQFEKEYTDYMVEDIIDHGEAND